MLTTADEARALQLADVIHGYNEQRDTLERSILRVPSGHRTLVRTLLYFRRVRSVRTHNPTIYREASQMPTLPSPR
jgi:hypothetical protein